MSGVCIMRGFRHLLKRKHGRLAVSETLLMRKAKCAVHSRISASVSISANEMALAESRWPTVRLVGFSRIYLNEARQAKEDGDAAARAAALVGQPRAELLGETMGVFACYELGNFELVKDYLERVMRLSRQLKAQRFEAQALEMQARLLLETGHREEAAEKLRHALQICKETGTQFCGPKVTSALSRAVDDPQERAELLFEGKEMLGCRPQSFVVLSRRHRGAFSRRR
jgi:tetratricopeptide (TPR) repeat protein